MFKKLEKPEKGLVEVFKILRVKYKIPKTDIDTLHKSAIEFGRLEYMKGYEVGKNIHKNTANNKTKFSTLPIIE